ncbi:MAG: DUF4358 domain-containing protein [Oscillospiraceae bacterium]|nr:DUF4358 domain-containing protein [Oscillospiraceae bacterium]
MKRLIYFLLIICCICSLEACKAPSKIPNLKELMVEIEQQVAMKNMMDLNADELEEICYIEKLWVRQFAAKISNTGINSDEIIFVEAIDEEAVKKIFEAIEKRYLEKRNQAAGYLPEELALIEKAKKESKGKFVSFIVSADVEKINKIYLSKF